MIHRIGQTVRRALAVVLLSALPVCAVELPSSPTILPDRSYAAALLSGIQKAQKRISCVYYLFNTGRGKNNLPWAVARELAAARRRGVEVTVLLEEKKPVRQENRTAALYLARNGVRVLFPVRMGVIHAKAMVIDDRFVYLGSHNLTQAALSRNSELSLMMDDPKLAEEVRRYLEKLAGGSYYVVAP